MITHVSLENFKSIKGIKDLELKPLTLFTGSNSSGKSNILEGIGLFAEAARMSRVPGEENVGLTKIFSQGDLKKYPWRQMADFISFKKKPENTVDVEIDMAPDSSLSNEIFEIFATYGFHPKPASLNSVGYGVSFRFSDDSFSQYVKSNKQRVATVAKTGNTPSFIQFEKSKERIQVQDSADHIFKETAFQVAGPTPTKKSLESEITIAILRYVRDLCERIYLISGERGNIDAELNVEQETRRQQRAPTWVGSRGQRVIEVLSRIIMREPEKAETIRQWAAKFQIPEVKAGYVEGMLESNFMDRHFNIGLNSALAGLGSRQILSIIVQIFSAERGSVIMIEEPEISLHPESQVLLHELFAVAISQGKQIICTTHSPFLILAISRTIGKKLLKVDDVAIYHVEKSREGTKPKELELNKHGFLVSGVPSFMKIERELFREWSETLEEV